MGSKSGELLVTRLKALRRRATLVLFAQALCLSGGLAVLIAEALLVGGAVHDAAAIGIAATAILLTAAASTILLRPDLHGIAASVDARLHLQDRLVTALEFNAAIDPFSQLVTMDAHSRIAAVRASEAVPFALPLGIRVVSVAAAVVSGVMVVAITVAPRWSSAGWTGFGGPGVTANTVGAAAAVISAQASQQGSPGAGASNTTNARSELTAARQQQAASDQAGAATASARARSVSEVAAPSNSDTERLEHEATTRGDTTSTNISPNTPTDAGVAGNAATTSQEQRGGGVANGARAMRSPGVAARPDDPAYRAAYRSGRAAAESAVAHDRVPADLRSYVRDYFVAIRPAGDK